MSQFRIDPTHPWFDYSLIHLAEQLALAVAAAPSAIALAEALDVVREAADNQALALLAIELGATPILAGGA